MVNATCDIFSFHAATVQVVIAENGRRREADGRAQDRLLSASLDRPRAWPFHGW